MINISKKNDEYQFMTWTNILDVKHATHYDL